MRHRLVQSVIKAYEALRRRPQRRADPCARPRMPAARAGGRGRQPPAAPPCRPSRGCRASCAARPARPARARRGRAGARRRPRRCATLNAPLPRQGQADRRAVVPGPGRRGRARRHRDQRGHRRAQRAGASGARCPRSWTCWPCTASCTCSATTTRPTTAPWTGWSGGCAGGCCRASARVIVVLRSLVIVLLAAVSIDPGRGGGRLLPGQAPPPRPPGHAEPARGAREPLPRGPADAAHAHPHGHLHRARGHDRHHHHRCSSTASHHWALLVAFGVMVVYLLLFRLTVPYSLVRRNPERSLLLLLPVFDAYARALRPLVVRAAPPRRGVPRRTTRRPTARPPVPEVPPAPVHDQNEGRLVDAVARFAVTQVRDVMTPRPDIVALPGDRHRGRPAPRAARDQVQPRARLRREPRRHRGRGRACATSSSTRAPPADPLQPLVRAAFLVPETKKIAELLKEFQARRITFAVAIDEYGGTAGPRDGGGHRRGDRGRDQGRVRRRGGADHASSRTARCWWRAGSNVDRLEQALEASLADGEDVGTVGGLVAIVFGRIPRPGERTELPRLHGRGGGRGAQARQPRALPAAPAGGGMIDEDAAGAAAVPRGLRHRGRAGRTWASPRS